VADRPGSRASGKPVKFGTCSSQVLAIFLDSHTSQYERDDKKQLIWDMATAMNTELRQLAAGRRQGHPDRGADDPLHGLLPSGADRAARLHGRAFNHEVEGLDDVELWIHTCWGNPNMQKVYSGESYENSIDIYLNRLKGDVWTVEATENELAQIDLFKPYASNLSKKIAGRRRQPSTAARPTSRRSSRARAQALEVIPATS
jgi:5-methyltetrahydropteroyltriglutamate--homocysteine methyltransferase